MSSFTELLGTFSQLKTKTKQIENNCQHTDNNWQLSEQLTMPSPCLQNLSHSEISLPSHPDARVKLWRFPSFPCPIYANETLRAESQMF